MSNYIKWNGISEDGSDGDKKWKNANLTWGDYQLVVEIAEVIERFFFDVGIMDQPTSLPVNDNGVIKDYSPPKKPTSNSEVENVAFKLCPMCGEKSLKLENGCDSCMECGYSKCDK